MVYDMNTQSSLAGLARSIVDYAYSDSIEDSIDRLIAVDENGNTFDIYEVSIAERIFGYVSTTHDIRYTKRQNNNRAVKIVMNNMGFVSIKDYLKSYPGSYDTNTINRKLSLSDSDQLSKVYMICSKYFFNNITYLDLIEYNTLVAYPLLHDTMHCAYFYTVDKKDLWFCKDWNDDDGSVSL